MQRRAAAVYFVLFVVVSAGAYAYVGMADRPQVDLAGESYTEGNTFTAGDRTYTVSSIGDGSGELTWTDPDATETTTLESNSTISWRTVSWADQSIETVTLLNGSTVTFNERASQVVLNGSTDPPTLRVEAVDNRSVNTTFERGGAITIEHDDQYVPAGTITNITGTEATVSWGSEYRVVIPNETDPTSAALVQQQNVTRLLLTDNTVADSLGEYPNGTQYVQYRNNTRQSLDAYLPTPETKSLVEGETLAYMGNETTIGNITSSGVPLNRTVAQTVRVGLSEGESTDLNGESYFVHFPDAGTVRLAPNTTETHESYRSTQSAIDSYEQRKAGLWGVVLVSAFAGILLVGLASLPNKD